ncbi:MAG: pseudouridine synthase [Puniceicoccales bacterium]|nr:pseudouridine synthase [Puniceicoccales bacterium]
MANVDRNLSQTGVRLQKFLSEAGVCSRRSGEEAILRGEVLIDNQRVALGTRVLAGQLVTFHGVAVPATKISKRRTVLALNKPRGYICSHSDPLHGNEETIYALLAPYKNHKLICCGRLDKDSEGLVVLTDDGNLASQLMHPTHGILKHYHVTIDKPLRERHRLALLDGICDDGENLTLKSIRSVEGSSRKVDITLSCGKKRHIRRMLSAFDYTVKSLERYQIGGLTLDGIRRGRYFILQEKHMRKLFPQCLGEACGQ